MYTLVITRGFLLISLFVLINGFTHPPFHCYTCNHGDEEGCKMDSKDMRKEDWGGEVMFPKELRGMKYFPFCWVTYKVGDANTVIWRSGDRTAVGVEEMPEDHCEFNSDNTETCYCHKEELCNTVPECRLRLHPEAEC